MIIVNLAFEGYFTSMPLIKCKGILPTKEVINSHDTISIDDISDERHIFTYFAADEFRLRSLFLSKYPC